MGQHDGQGAPGGREHYSRIAAQWLRRAWRVPDPRLMGGAHELVATVERALRRRARRRVAARWTARGLAGTTAVAAAAAVVLALRGAPPSPDRPGRPTRAGSDGVGAVRALGAAGGPVDRRALVLAEGVGPPAALAPGADVSATRGEPVRMTSAEGTELVLEAGSSLTVVEVGAIRRFALLRGAVRAQVHELQAGDRFLIDTADAEVEVHGTRFRVETGVESGDRCESAAGARRAGRSAREPAIATRVSVQAGVVAVRSRGHEARLLAGDTWPARAACASATSSPSRRTPGTGPSRPMATLARLPRPSEAPAPEPSAPATAAPEPLANGAAPSPARAVISDLATQNNLFAAAVAARRSGQTGRALDLYQQLVDRFPDSSLVESALAAKMRVLVERGDGRAAQAAAIAYLARFPDGFARAEARALGQAAAARHP